MAEKVSKLADKSHKDRVNEFNSKLEALSEHHDIPKVCCFISNPYRPMLTSGHLGWTWLTLRDAFFLPTCCPFVPLPIVNSILYYKFIESVPLFAAIPEVSGANHGVFKHEIAGASTSVPNYN